MRVGTVREIKNHEYRVGLTPESVRELAAHGHEVWVESGAGLGIGASDADYRQAGATGKCSIPISTSPPIPSRPPIWSSPE